MGNLPPLYEMIKKQPKSNSIEPVDKYKITNYKEDDNSEEYWNYLFKQAKENNKREFKTYRDSDEYFDYLVKQAESYSSHDKIFGPEEYNEESKTENYDTISSLDDAKDILKGGKIDII